jgi:Lysozyme like domain
MSLSISQLLAVAAAAGFSGDDLATAVSIALAESGGNPQAYNPEHGAGAAQGKGSYGLWQIYITAHPEYSAAQLLDPGYNAQAAYAVYSQAGSTFRPWSTFGNGAYLAHVDTVNGIIAAASGDQTASGDGGPVPGDGGILGMAIVGALALWLAMKFLG